MFWEKVRHRFWIWLLLAIAAAALILVIHYFSDINYGMVTGKINYSYSGIEHGVDPSGNRFDVTDLKQDVLVRQAAEQAGLGLDGAALENVRDAILVVGSVSSDWIESIIEHNTIFSSEDGIPNSLEIRESSYFPAQYTVYVNYLASGLTKAQGTAFLEALLSVYGEYFNTLYGYNQAIEETIQSIDYNEYDYFYSMEVLRESLSSLRSFLSRLADSDYSRFRSKETGYSFSDLINAIDTIQSEDIDWLNFYINNNSVTKNREDRIAYLEYQIESAQREQRAEESNLETLNVLIQDYEKTRAVILSLATTDGDDNEALQDFQFFQQSDTYDSLVNQRVNLQTSIRETKERITLYKTRIERMENAGTPESVEIVDERLEQIDQKVKQLVAMTSQTASEYYREYRLKDAFQILSVGSSPAGEAVSLAMRSMTDLLAAEGILFGLYLLYGILAAVRVGTPHGAAEQRQLSGKGPSSDSGKEIESER